MDGKGRDEMGGPDRSRPDEADEPTRTKAGRLDEDSGRDDGSRGPKKSSDENAMQPERRKETAKGVDDSRDEGKASNESEAASDVQSEEAEEHRADDGMRLWQERAWPSKKGGATCNDWLLLPRNLDIGTCLDSALQTRDPSRLAVTNLRVARSSEVPCIYSA
ncbi:hypothetical protein F503_03017 [Ophiostoma piceae UAMH 11346]|uniref:Uncharacterized protein n=1 Tax=Ophiostoma piceae (strain UAMH 11346) TaxID=1262450 RepID=S3CIJ7_OPHP1|nr:hypothetical protein F503_03017 [Ophiostoma piceae UAMH 11346]